MKILLISLVLLAAGCNQEVAVTSTGGGAVSNPAPVVEEPIEEPVEEPAV